MSFHVIFYYRMEMREGMKSSKYFHLFGLLPCPLLDALVNVSQGREQGVCEHSEAQKDKLLWLNNIVLSKAWAQRTGKVPFWFPNFCMH